MRPKVRENIFVTLLRQYYTTPSCLRSSIIVAPSSRPQKRSLHINTAAYQPLLSGTPANRSNNNRIQDSNDNPSRAYATSSTDVQAPNEIAVLGGGITGLATAFFLTKELPDAKITIYEASNYLGGWLYSKRVNVGDGTILLEQGPRTLRPGTPAGALTLDMIGQLGLEQEIITTPRTSVAAQNRYVYYPDRLVTMPGPGHSLLSSLWTILTEPAFEEASSACWEYTRPKRPDDLQDESVGSFLRRRLGTSKIGDNIASAVLHGIYAGDIEQLSVKSLLPRIWDAEGDHGSLADSIFENIKLSFRGKSLILDRDMILSKELRLRNLKMLKTSLSQGNMSGAIRRREISTSAVYSFKNGISSLSAALADHLRKSENVEIKTGHNIDQLEYREANNSVYIKSNQKGTPPKVFSRVISTISGRKLSSLTLDKPGSASLLPGLAHIHSVTVMVVNLFFTNPEVLPAHGFGYLIPRSIPFEQNPECALGVVFDSDAMVGQDTASGTKVTVMMGGHWWDHYSAGTRNYPTEDEGAAMAKAVLKRHLGINEEPAKVLVTLQKDCIPQYTVGHEERMKRAHEDLMDGFGGRLAVAGSSYGGVGLNDCVRSAWDVVRRLKDAAGFGSGLPGPGLAVTGLEHFLQKRKYVVARRRPPMLMVRRQPPR